MTPTLYQADANQTLSSARPELEQLFSRIKRLINLVTHQANQLDELQYELTALKQEHQLLLSEHECLMEKVNSAQSHIRTMLAQLPENVAATENMLEYEKQKGE